MLQTSSNPRALKVQSSNPQWHVAQALQTLTPLSALSSPCVAPQRPPNFANCGKAGRKKLHERISPFLCVMSQNYVLYIYIHVHVMSPSIYPSIYLSVCLMTGKAPTSPHPRIGSLDWQEICWAFMPVPVIPWHSYGKARKSQWERRWKEEILTNHYSSFCRQSWSIEFGWILISLFQNSKSLPLKGRIFSSLSSKK